MEAWIMQLQSFCIVALMVVGLYFRRRRNLHVKIMSVAMVWDVILILQIELSRSAIIKATKAVTNTLSLNIHVTIAVSTVLLYGFMIYTGRKMLQSRFEYRQRHRTLGYLTFVMRVLTFATSFWAVAPKV